MIDTETKPATKSLTVHLPADLHKQAKMQAASEGVKIRELVIRALQAELKRIAS